MPKCPAIVMQISIFSHLRTILDFQYDLEEGFLSITTRMVLVRILSGYLFSFSLVDWSIWRLWSHARHGHCEESNLLKLQCQVCESMSILLMSCNITIIEYYCFWCVCFFPRRKCSQTIGERLYKLSISGRQIYITIKTTQSSTMVIIPLFSS